MAGSLHICNATRASPHNVCERASLLMTKPPEEGEIWEWRAFGQPSEATLDIIRNHPIRTGVKDHRGEDLYLISPISDQNVKLRQWKREWVLKFKLLLTTAKRGIELYTETAGWVHRFPIGPELLSHAARLLGTSLPESAESATKFSAENLIDILAHATPPIFEVRVRKLRSQFDFGDGWVELSEARFPNQTIQSLSIHSPKTEVVELILDLLETSPEMEVMNYVEACRRWG